MLSVTCDFKSCVATAVSLGDTVSTLGEDDSMLVAAAVPTKAWTLPVSSPTDGWMMLGLRDTEVMLACRGRGAWDGLNAAKLVAAAVVMGGDCDEAFPAAVVVDPGVAETPIGRGGAGTAVAAVCVMSIGVDSDVGGRHSRASLANASSAKVLRLPSGV